jgi:hypothetical protein
MLSQALEDLRIYSSEASQIPTQHNYLNSLLHTSSHPPTAAGNASRSDSPDMMNISSILLTPTRQQQHQESFENSFHIHDDGSAVGRGVDGRRGRGHGDESQHLMNLGEGDEEFSGIYASSSSQLYSFQLQGGSQSSPFLGASEEDDDSNSVESYSRIAGRLSLDSSSGY